MQYDELSQDIPDAIPGVGVLRSAVRVDNGQVYLPTLDYATSKDGIQWTRPKLGLFYPQRLGDENRIFHVHYFEDTEETALQRRFKGVLFEGNWIYNSERPLVYSADALHWSPAGQNAEGIEYVHEHGGPSYRDPYDGPQRRFKAVGRTRGIFGGRALGIMYSPDLIHWEGAEPRYLRAAPYAGPTTNWILWRGRLSPRLILDPLGEPKSEQVEMGALWVERDYGMYLCLYAPKRFSGITDFALAASRDGMHFYRIKNASRVLRAAGGGQWDSGFLEIGSGLISFSGPIRMGDETWLYYSGTPYHIGVPGRPVGRPVSGPPLKFQGQSYVGIATMRVDGWAYLTLSENEHEGRVTTVPLTFDLLGGRTLKVNVDGLDHGKLVAEVLDPATNEPLVGYSRGDSIPVLENGLEKPVTWRDHEKLPDDPKRQLKLRFYLRGAGARFYGFKLSN
jgi:hypothetical protein